MKGFCFLSLVALAVASAEAKAGIGIQNQHNVPWYSCEGKRDGDYIHPNNCHKFMACSGGIASEMDCPICHFDPVTCPDGELVYNVSQDKCLWANETPCETENSNFTTPESGESSPTQSPPTGPPQEGDPCNPDICRNTGYCKTYLRCDKQNKTLVKEECGLDLVWNPNGSGAIHGGNCDNWNNVDDDIQRAYRKDPECLACFWKELGECERDYLYQPPYGLNRNVSRLSCGEGLVFVEGKETCQRCEDSFKGDATSCC